MNHPCHCGDLVLFETLPIGRIHCWTANGCSVHLFKEFAVYGYLNTTEDEDVLPALKTFPSALPSVVCDHFVLTDAMLAKPDSPWTTARIAFIDPVNGQALCVECTRNVLLALQDKYGSSSLEYEAKLPKLSHKRHSAPCHWCGELINPPR